MSSEARSKSCQEAASTKHSLRSQDSQRMTQEKRERRSTDKKHVAGVDVELGSIKDEHIEVRGRSRSKSPRRNSWREEIKQIKSWKEERENKEIKLEDLRRERKSGNRVLASQKNSKCYTKAARKFDLYSSRKFFKKDARLVKKETDCIVNRKGRDMKERLSSSLAVQKRGERLSRLKQVKNIVKDVEVGLVTRRQDERERLDRTKAVQALGISSKDPAEISDDELELRISDKDIIPELRDEQVDEESDVVLDVVRDNRKDNASTKNREGLEIKMNRLIEEKVSSKSNAKVVDVMDQAMEDEPAKAQPQDRSSSSTSSASIMSGEDSSAMARNFSLLELKMEVYTTRLKELEWEREQLRKEREEFQDKERFVKRDLVKSLLIKKKLIADVHLCERENKENKG